MDPTAQPWILYTYEPGAPVPAHAYRGYAGGDAFNETTAQQIAAQVNSAQSEAHLTALALPLEDAIPSAGGEI